MICRIGDDLIGSGRHIYRKTSSERTADMRRGRLSTDTTLEVPSTVLLVARLRAPENGQSPSGVHARIAEEGRSNARGNDPFVSLVLQAR